jgi:hypothetical protein
LIFFLLPFSSLTSSLLPLSLLCLFILSEVWLLNFLRIGLKWWANCLATIPTVWIVNTCHHNIMYCDLHDRARHNYFCIYMYIKMSHLKHAAWKTGFPLLPRPRYWNWRKRCSEQSSWDRSSWIFICAVVSKKQGVEPSEVNIHREILLSKWDWRKMWV